MKVRSIKRETSSADFVLNVLISCGKNAIVVSKAATNPNTSGEFN